MFNLIFTSVNAQKKSFYPEGTENKKSQNKHQKEDRSKEEYQYKNYYYLALKQKALDNFDEAVKYFEKCIKLNNLEAASFYEISKIYLEKNNIKESLEYAKKAFFLEKENKWYAVFYAENLFVNKKYLEAIKVYKNLIKLDKENEDYYLELAKNYLYNNDLKSAIRTYNALETIKGINHYTSTQKHKIYTELKDFKNAARELELLLSEYPFDIQIYEMLSDCYILEGDFDKAFDTFQKIVKLNPNSATIHLTLSDYYLHRGNHEKYEEELEKAFLSKYLDPVTKLKKIVPLLSSLTSNTDSSFLFIFKLSNILISLYPELETPNMIHAELLQMDNQLESALFYYKIVVKKNPNQQRSWEKLLFLELELTNLDSLNTYSEQAIELFPTNSLFYYLNGLSYFYNKDYLNTIEAMEIGINFVASNPNLSSEIYSILGNSYNEINDFKKSDESFDKALEFSPNNVQVLNNYAYYLSLRGENLKKAKQMSMKTIEMFPNEANYFDTYAWILYKMKNYMEAKIWMQKALDITESQTFYDHMVDILTELGELEQAEIYRIIEPKNENNE